MLVFTELSMTRCITQQCAMCVQRPSQTITKLSYGPPIFALNMLLPPGRAFFCTLLLDGINHRLIKRNSKTKSTHDLETSPLAKKFPLTLFLREIMETVFWDHQGTLLVDFLDRGDNAPADRHCGTLEGLQQEG